MAIWILALTVALAEGLAVSRGAAAPASTATVRISPSLTTINQFQTTSVDIYVDNPGDLQLYGADVRLAFSPAIIQAQDSVAFQSGIQIMPGPLLTTQPDYFILRNTAQNITGTAEFIITELNPSSPVTASGVLATITFKGMAGNYSPVAFTYVKLSDRNGVQIPSTTQDGQINVMAPTAVRLESFTAIALPAEGTVLGSAQLVGPDVALNAALALGGLAVIISVLGAGWFLRRR